MTRETISAHSIALLATGDEITNGDILNTNSQIIAQKCFKNGMHIGIHMSAPDNINEIEQAIEHLLKSHQALIITGGLGPTSDDLTRYALSKALKLPLAFNDAAWEAICERFRSLGYKEAPPSGNHQQALFPDGAMIISNPNGTAAGCMIHQHDILIFMLPGPPIECLPMVDQVVIPALKKQGFQEKLFYEHWLLFGVSEGQIAEELDALAKPYHCMTGYRLAYPYIEFKLYSNHQHDFEKLVPQVDQAVAPYLMMGGKQPASLLLQHMLETINFTLSIRDFATGGLLENTLQTPRTFTHLDFFNHANPMVTIKGLDDYWSGTSITHTHIEISFANGHVITKKIPFRGNRVKQYAVEFICDQIYQFLTTNDIN